MVALKVLIVEHEPMARKLLEIYINNSEKYTLSYSIKSAKTGFRNRTELAVRVRESGFVINDHKAK